MKKTMAAVMAAIMICFAPGCATTDGSGMSDADVALLALDLKDIAREGTIVALAENPDWRANIMVVRDQLANLSGTSDVITFDTLLTTLQGLPVEELQSTEARLAITSARIILRRTGRNIELGNVSNIRPLVIGLADGMTAGLQAPGVVK